MPKTKIIATLGPASSTETILRKMILSGLDVARLNFSHGSDKSHLDKIKIIRKLNKKYRRHIKVLQDLKGNRIRIGRLKGAKPLSLKTRQTVYLTKENLEGFGKIIPFDYRGSLKPLKKGFFIFIDDGNICLKIKKILKTKIETEVVAGGYLKERKGVNIPEARLDFPLLNEDDIKDLKFAIKHKVDYIALSFVRSEKEIIAAKSILKSLLPNCKIIAKIEAREAVKNIDKIIDASDAIMIARGDMGISFPIYQIPIIQKLIIKKCNLKKKPVITATQMLESMTERFQPTRAEVSDVANAILDGSDYVMLSGESAAGKYPVESVEMMNKIIKYTEQSLTKV
ncbi:MAG: pyruvate kinase [Elusimicrobia bacterium]|nr:pyruvate kinase [Elusimicrobiota bacterium]